MTPIKTLFFCSKETEAQRLLDIAIFIRNRFFQQKGFLLLPYDVGEKFSGREIYFPDLPYPKSFWAEAEKLAKEITRLSIPVSENKVVIAETVSLLSEPLPDTSSLEKKWHEVESKFWKFCQATFPEKVSNLKKLTIYATCYDRISSFNAPDTTAPYEIAIWAHFDEDVSAIAEAILLSIFRADHDKQGFTWEESESFADNLLVNTKLGKVFPNFRPTLLGTRSAGHKQFLTDSTKYYGKLGFPSKPIFSYSDGILIANDHQINNHLTPIERSLLQEMVLSHGSTVSFEKIGNLLWGDLACEKYSEYAITKTIQRLREKISALGITPEVIGTKRKEGYYLIN